MNMNKDISKAIQIAQMNRNDFNCSVLKKEMHVCTRYANEILNELKNQGIVTIIYKPSYKIKVLV